MRVLRLRVDEPLPDVCLHGGESECARVEYGFDRRVDWRASLPGALLAIGLGLGFAVLTHRRCVLPLCAMCHDDLLRQQRRATVIALSVMFAMYGSIVGLTLTAIATGQPIGTIAFAAIAPAVLGTLVLFPLRRRRMRAAGWDVWFDGDDRTLVVGHAAKPFVRALHALRRTAQARRR